MIYSNKSEMLLDVEYLDGTDESLQESKEWILTSNED